MKKKTVITSEKHEVWVIRQSTGETNEQDPPNGEAGTMDVVTLPTDQYSEIDMIPDATHD